LLAVRIRNWILTAADLDLWLKAELGRPLNEEDNAPATARRRGFSRRCARFAGYSRKYFVGFTGVSLTVTS
jgi:hypothetical protein